jgi:hypothetical protein
MGLVFGTSGGKIDRLVYHRLQIGAYTNSYKDRVIPVTRGTTGATGHASAPPQPMRVRGFDPGKEYAHVNQQSFGSPTDRRRLTRRLAHTPPWPDLRAITTRFTRQGNSLTE